MRVCELLGGGGWEEGGGVDEGRIIGVGSIIEGIIVGGMRG